MINKHIDNNTLYVERKILVQEKIFIVQHLITNEIYIKKILNIENVNLYELLKIKDNKNRAKIIDYFIDYNRLIVIEEFINGQTVEEILNGRNIGVDEAVRITIGVCNAISDIQNINITHGAINPSNIMIQNDGLVKLIGFDIIKSLNNINHEIKDRFASPEIVGFSQTDTRSDIYSIGILLNYMILKEIPPEKIVGGEFEKIIRKATEIDKNNRFQNIDEFRYALSIINSEDKINKRQVYKNSNLQNTNNLNLRKIVKKDVYINQNINNKNYYNSNYNNNTFVNNNLDINERNFFRKIVGYRNLKLINVILASIWYFIASFGIIISIREGLDNLFLVIYMFILPEFVLGNGFGINRNIPFVNNLENYKNKNGRIILGVILTLITSLLLNLFAK